MKLQSYLVSTVCLIASFTMAPNVFGHCDAIDGPVVLAAQRALDAGNVTAVLRWVRPEDEAAIREAFALATKVRREGEAAEKLADTYFFETVVRIHRQGEGAPYSGLKPAGMIDPPIAHADEALREKSIDALVAHATEELANNLRRRYQRVNEAAAHADQSVEAGREWVEAYVDYVHFIERMHDVLSAGAHGEAEPHSAPDAH